MANARHKQARFRRDVRTQMTPQQIAEMFDDYADDYEQEALDTGLRGHEIVGDHLAKLYPDSDRTKVKVLDVAAGTGLVGLKLMNLGFSNVDALDPSQKMLDKAKDRGIYQRLICAFINQNKVEDIETDYYDCVTANSAFNEGLIPCVGFYELIRVVKPGGYIVFTISDANVANSVEYRGRFLPLISKMSDEGIWTVTTNIFPDGISTFRGAGTLYCLKVHVSECAQQHKRAL